MKGEKMNTLKKENEHLVLDNLGLVRYIARKINTSNLNIELEDKISIGTIGLIKAANTFDENMGIKFSTYAGKCITNEILIALRKAKKEANVLHFDDIVMVQNNGVEFKLEDLICDKKNYFDEFHMKLVFENLFNWVLNQKDFRKRNIILLRLAGIKQPEIASILGCSQSYISRLERKIIKEIKSVVNRKYVIDRICDFRKNDENYQITLYVPNLRRDREVLKIIEEEKQKIQLKYFEIEESSNKKVVIKLLAEDSAVLFMANILNQLN